MTSNKDDLNELRRELKSRRRQRVWDKLWMVLGGIFLICWGPGLYFGTVSEGSEAIDKMAAQKGFCAAASCSDAERAEFVKVILDKTDYTSEPQLRWCLGVDSWASVRVGRGGWLIGPMMDVGYLFCPNG
jgi:hypothetical protein